MIKEYFNSIQFAWPYALLGLLLLPWLYWYSTRLNKTRLATLKYPNIKDFKTFTNAKIRFKNVPLIIRMLAMACIIVAIAQPIKKNTNELNQGNGIDIMLCLDISGSMLAQDFKPNRLEAAKNVILDFIARRKGDRLGLVTFSGESFTICPVTADKNILSTQVQSVEYGQLQDGTAIGSGIASSVDRIKNSTAKTKIIILLTDGENTGGLIDPQTAKELAKTFAIKIYTIGVGTNGYAPTPFQTPMGTVMQNEKVSIDEKLLTQIATETNGKYFRATDKKSLEDIYKEIDTLEKSKVESIVFTKKEDKFFPWVMATIILLVLENVLKYTVFRKFP
jgi:Ca-activated chloride channel homolog